MSADDLDLRYRRAMRRLVAWFTVGIAAVAAYTALALSDVSLLLIWPLLAVAAVSSFKLFTLHP